MLSLSLLIIQMPDLMTTSRPSASRAPQYDGFYSWIRPRSVDLNTYARQLTLYTYSLYLVAYQAELSWSTGMFAHLQVPVLAREAVP